MRNETREECLGRDGEIGERRWMYEERRGGKVKRRLGRGDKERWGRRGDGGDATSC